MGLHPLPCAGFGGFYPRFLALLLVPLLLLATDVSLAQSPETSRASFSQVDSQSHYLTTWFLQDWIKHMIIGFCYG